LSELNHDTVKRIHGLLAGIAQNQLTTIPLVQAAAIAGDIELLEAVLTQQGATAFVGVDAKGRRVDALECAAAANRTEVMRWLLSSGAITAVSHQLSSGGSGQEREITCTAARLAANSGAFEALALMAKFVPEITSRRMWDSNGVLNLSRKLGGSDDSIQVHNAGFMGLLTGARYVAGAAGADIGAMAGVMRGFIEGGAVPLRNDIDLAVRLGDVEAFSAMLSTRVRISPSDFFSALKESTRAASMLSAFCDHVVETRSGFSDMFYDDDSVRMPGSYDEFVGIFADRDVTRYGKIGDALTSFGFMAQRARYFATGSYAGEIECDEEFLAEQMIRFFKLIMPAGISPDMLARAAGADSFVLTRRLLEEGVDPNSRPFWWENATLDGRAAIHRCVSADMIRLLHVHGADVALSVRHSMAAGGKEIEGNLFTLMCAERDSPEMIEAFVQCGGDLGQKFGGRTITQLATHRSDRFKEAIKSVKSGLVIAGAIEPEIAITGRARSTGPAVL
jgi:hypothetical protein